MDGSDELVKELKSHVRHEVGPIAMPAEIEFVPSCPRPAVAKIMRRLLEGASHGSAGGRHQHAGRLTLHRFVGRQRRRLHQRIDIR
ncbi:MAG: hypothetical protein R2838_01500 [Caldilineaceae bacterium]